MSQVVGQKASLSNIKGCTNWKNDGIIGKGVIAHALSRHRREKSVSTRGE